MICIDSDSELDEDSDVDDPEQQLRAELARAHDELADRSAMIEAVQGALQCLQNKKSHNPRSR